MIDKISIFKSSGLPDPFGLTLLLLSLILFLSPYLSGADFGIFKIPQFSPQVKNWFKVIGPIIFILMILCYLPIIAINSPNNSNQGNTNDVTLANTPTSSLKQTPTSTSTTTPTQTPADVADTASNRVEKGPIELPAVSLKVSEGEHLHYWVKAEGAGAQFTFANTHQVIATEKVSAGPIYEWEWPRATDVVEPENTLGFSMNFVSATKYKLVIEKHDRQHHTQDVLLSTYFISDNPNASYTQLLNVLTN
jgi:hypothetical protein